MALETRCSKCGHNYSSALQFPKLYVDDFVRPDLPKEVLTASNQRYLFVTGFWANLFSGRPRVPKEVMPIVRDDKTVRFEHNGLIYLRMPDLRTMFAPYEDITEQVKGAIGDRRIKNYLSHLQAIKGRTTSINNLRYHAGEITFVKKDLKFSCLPVFESNGSSSIPHRSRGEPIEPGKDVLDVLLGVTSSLSPNWPDYTLLASVFVEGRFD